MLAIFSEDYFYERRHVPRVTTTRMPRPEWNFRIFKEEKREDALRASLVLLDNDSVQAGQDDFYKIMGTTNMMVKFDGRTFLHMFGIPWTDPKGYFMASSDAKRSPASRSSELDSTASSVLNGSLGMSMAPQSSPRLHPCNSRC